MNPRAPEVVPTVRAEIPSPDIDVLYGRPVVFGEPARPLAGRLHITRGPLRGAAVLCPPWGYEDNSAFATYQAIAAGLAARGIEALRFDYDGCGNSFGQPTDPQRLGRWVASCGQAIEWMRQRSGGPVDVVGMRLGAALAVLASAQQEIRTAVLWDPVVSGRRYLRMLRAMTMMGVDAGPDPEEPGSLLAIGNLLPAAAVGELERLDLRSLGATRIGRALLIARPAGDADARRLAQALTELGSGASIEAHAGTEKMLDCPAEQSTVPANIVERICEVLAADAALNEPRPAPPAPAGRALLLPSGARWSEEYLRIGPIGLNAVLTLPEERRRAGVVIMANNGVARAIGPARAWVNWARQWADEGIASLRLDLSGLGDSPRHDGQRPGEQYPVEAIADFASAIEELRGRGLTPAVALGLCSGAFLSIDAVAGGAGLTAVFGINAQVFHLPDPPGSPQRLRRAAPPTAAWLQHFMEGSRVGRRVARHLPYPGWRLLQLLRLTPSPLRGSDNASAAARIQLIYGESNAGLLKLRQCARADLRRWQDSGCIVVIPGLDHSMFAPHMTDRVATHARAFLREVLPALAPEQAAPVLRAVT